jgi:hypothetical protein
VTKPCAIDQYDVSDAKSVGRMFRSSAKHPEETNTVKKHAQWVGGMFRTLNLLTKQVQVSGQADRCGCEFGGSKHADGQISDRSAGGSVFGVDFGVREMSEV